MNKQQHLCAAPIDVELLEECLRSTTALNVFILNEAVRTLERELAALLPGFRAVGVNNLFSAAVLLAFGADDITAHLGAPRPVHRALLAAHRSSARDYRSDAPRPTGRWSVRDSDSAYETPVGDRTAVVVREPSSLPDCRSADAVVLDLSGSHELPTAGEMAVMFTRDVELEAYWRSLRNHGQPVGRRFHHEHVGVNARVDEVNARYVSALLPGLAERAKRLAEARTRIVDAWSAFGAYEVPDRPGGGGVVLTERTDETRVLLAENGVPSRSTGEGILLPVHSGQSEQLISRIVELSRAAGGRE
ncbi:DegT/DnrJ/EryC1/StrS aminotransferase [Streptomyces coelicoflavus ZG0656]|nr:DegT/DnrJ/EryC1/StrS aminotransferase [Streptomyces coelicoflavus ZG0656]MZE49251.1 hypothetical protein [Streptomyces sp. SID5477]